MNNEEEYEELLCHRCGEIYTVIADLPHGERPSVCDKCEYEMIYSGERW